jgi:hypothetical protein
MRSNRSSAHRARGYYKRVSNSQPSCEREMEQAMVRPSECRNATGQLTLLADDLQVGGESTSRVEPVLAAAVESTLPRQGNRLFPFSEWASNSFRDGHLTHPDSAVDRGPPHAQIAAREADSGQQTLDQEIEGPNPSSPASYPTGSDPRALHTTSGGFVRNERGAGSKKEPRDAPMFTLIRRGRRS